MTKISVSLPDDVVSFLDDLVVHHRFPNRSKALAEATHCLQKTELDRQYEEALKKLNPEEEKVIANSFGEKESEWPKY